MELATEDRRISGGDESSRLSLDYLAADLSSYGV